MEVTGQSMRNFARLPVLSHRPIASNASLMLAYVFFLGHQPIINKSGLTSQPDTKTYTIHYSLLTVQSSIIVLRSGCIMVEQNPAASISSTVSGSSAS